jgi:hypothetical protein
LTRVHARPSTDLPMASPCSSVISQAVYSRIHGFSFFALACRILLAFSSSLPLARRQAATKGQDSVGAARFQPSAFSAQDHHLRNFFAKRKEVMDKDSTRGQILTSSVNEKLDHADPRTNPFWTHLPARHRSGIVLASFVNKPLGGLVETVFTLRTISFWSFGLQEFPLARRLTRVRRGRVYELQAQLQQTPDLCAAEIHRKDDCQQMKTRAQHTDQEPSELSRP